MKINYSNVKFSGYSNIITNSLRGSNDTSIDFIAMKLDDNGEKDLTKFREIKNMMDLSPEVIDKDILVYTNCIHNYIGEVGIFSKVMLNCGEGLLIAKQELSPDEYKNLEGFTLKAYTFVANLTKRIANDINLHNVITSDMQHVYEEALARIDSLFQDRRDSYNFVRECSTDKKEIDKTAKIINRKIAKSLSVLF